MKNKALISISCSYLLFSVMWLLMGTEIVDQIDENFPAIKDIHLSYIRNTIYIIGTSSAALIAANFYYRDLLRKERLHRQKVMEHEQELNQQIVLFDAVAKATNDVIWDYDLMSDRLTWVSGYLEVFGFPDEQNIPYVFWLMRRVHHEDREATIAVFRRVVERKEKIWRTEYRYECKDGSFKYVSDRGVVIFNDQGIPVRLLGAMQDIDELVRFSERITRQNEKLQAIAWLNAHEIRRPLTNLMGLMPLIKPALEDRETLIQIIEHTENSIKDLDDAVIKINKQV